MKHTIFRAIIQEKPIEPIIIWENPTKLVEPPEEHNLEDYNEENSLKC